MGARVSKPKQAAPTDRKMRSARRATTYRATGGAHRAKTARATGRRGLHDLLSLYQGLSGFHANTIGFSEYATTYGEVTDAGIHALSQKFQALAPLSKFPAAQRNFIDLGCGIGRVVVGMALLNSDLQAHGVEILPERIRSAKEAMERIRNRQVAKRVHIRQGNFLEPEISLRETCWVFVSNLCLDEATQRRLAEKLQELPVGAIILCSKEFPVHSGLEKVAQEIPVPMTWSASSTCVGYRRIR